MKAVPVAHVVLGLEIGGLERVVVNLSLGLQRRGIGNLVVCLEAEGQLAAELRAAGIPIHALGKRCGVDWSAVRRLASFLRFHKVRIVHTHNPTPHFHGAMARLVARAPVLVHTKHGRNYPNDRKRVLLNRVLAWCTDMIVPVSDNAARVALEIEHVNPQKVRRIWNGVDTEQYKPAPPGQQSATSCHVIGTVARLSPEKDQKTMLSAFGLLQKECPNSRLVFVGDGPCREELRSEARQLGLDRQVDFLGARSDVAALLPSFTLFTLSSITEGISMTILEAMACGVPVVATDVGGNREIVNPTECGLVVPPRQPQALADAWLALLRDPERRSQMGAAARARVMAQFSIEQMVNQYVALYQELLEAKHVH